MVIRLTFDSFLLRRDGVAIFGVDCFRSNWLMLEALKLSFAFGCWTGEILLQGPIGWLRNAGKSLTHTIFLSWTDT